MKLTSRTILSTYIGIPETNRVKEEQKKWNERRVKKSSQTKLSFLYIRANFMMRNFQLHNPIENHSRGQRKM